MSRFSGCLGSVSVELIDWALFYFMKGGKKNSICFHELKTGISLLSSNVKEKVTLGSCTFPHPLYARAVNAQTVGDAESAFSSRTLGKKNGIPI